MTNDIIEIAILEYFKSNRGGLMVCSNADRPVPTKFSTLTSPEHQKINDDIVNFGIGIMQDGKRINPADFYITEEDSAAQKGGV